MFKKKFIFSIFVVLILNQIYAQDQLVFDNRIYRDNIHTVQIYRGGNQLNAPVIKFNSDERIILGFDDFDQDNKDYYYSVYHCTYEWNADDLFFNEYAEGFDMNLIDDYRNSFNTFQKYKHYSLQIPNDDIKLLISGNYILSVFDGNDKDKPVLTRRFMVVEPSFNIQAEVKKPAMNQFRETHQRIEFSIQCPFKIANPEEDVKVVLCQNMRWDNAIFNLPAQYYKGNDLVYNYEKESLFPAGNEYRHADLKNVKNKALGIADITYKEDLYHFWLEKDKKRNRIPFSGDEDFNGKRFIKLENNEDSDIDADYVWVHFSLECNQPFLGSKVFVFGELSDWQCSPPNEMQYNKVTSVYESSMFLKQGYYNYEYVTLDETKGFIENQNTEGWFVSAENIYSIFTYYKEQGSRFYKLVGSKNINSIKNL